MAVNRLHTVQDFDEFVVLPENAERIFEYIDGEVLEKLPGRTRYSEYALMIAAAVIAFCREHNIPCHISGADGTYDISGNRVAPDFAYKQTPTSEAYPDPVPPLWTVEIISPTDERHEIDKKRKVYVEAGILLWQVERKDYSVTVYPVGQKEPIRYGVEDTIPVGNALPGLCLEVKYIFKL